MSRAEKFIQDSTRKCSNQYNFPEYFENGIKRLKEYQPWLTPDEAQKAVEIARKEVIEEICEYLSIEEHIPLWANRGGNFGCDNLLLIKNLKQAMKDE